MPIIPYFEEKGLNVGAPTPIGSSDTARLQGEAVEAFGKSLSTLGSVFAQEAKVAKDEQDEQEAVAAVSAWEKRRFLEIEQQKKVNPMADPFGRGFMQTIDANMKDYEGQLYETTLTSERAKRIFQMKKAQSESTFAPKELLAGVEGNAQYVKALRDQALGNILDTMALDPDNMNLHMDKATLLIEKDPNMSMAEKGAAIQAWRQNAVFAMADRYKQNNEFDLASHVLAQSAAEFPPEKRELLAKYEDGIKSAKATYINQERAASEYQVTLKERKQESQRNKMYSTLSVEADNALGDAFKMNQVIKKYELLAKADPDTYNEEFVKAIDARIKGGGAKVHILDENFEGQVFRAYMSPGKGGTFNYDAAVKAITKGRATQEKKNELYDKLRAISEGAKRDPTAGILLQETLKNIRAQAKGQFSAFDETLNPNRSDAEAAQQAMQFIKGLNGQITVDSINAASNKFKNSRPTYVSTPSAPLSKAGAQGSAKSTFDQLKEARYDLKRSEMSKAPRAVIERKKRNLHSLEQRFIDQNRGDAAKVGK